MEDALVRGPSGIRDLLERGITLIRMTLGDDPTNPLVGMTDGVQELLFSSNQVEFTERVYDLNTFDFTTRKFEFSIVR